MNHGYGRATRIEGAGIPHVLSMQVVKRTDLQWRAVFIADNPHHNSLSEVPSDPVTAPEVLQALDREPSTACGRAGIGN